MKQIFSPTHTLPAITACYTPITAAVLLWTPHLDAALAEWKAARLGLLLTTVSVPQNTIPHRQTSNYERMRFSNVDGTKKNRGAFSKSPWHPTDRDTKKKKESPSSTRAKKRDPTHHSPTHTSRPQLRTSCYGSSYSSDSHTILRFVGPRLRNCASEWRMFWAQSSPTHTLAWLVMPKSTFGDVLR